MGCKIDGKTTITTCVYEQLLVQYVNMRNYVSFYFYLILCIGSSVCQVGLCITYFS